MPQLIWSPAALRDIQRLYRFLNTHNPDAAKRAVKIIRERVTIIAMQPGVGRPTQHMDPEFREWPIEFGDSGYLVLYRFDGYTALLLAVRHQKEIGY